MERGWRGDGEGMEREWRGNGEGMERGWRGDGEIVRWCIPMDEDGAISPCLVNELVALLKVLLEVGGLHVIDVDGHVLEALHPSSVMLCCVVVC